MNKKKYQCEVSGRICPTLDEHHVIPREYGGIDGPTIYLDPAIHQAIHRYASNQRELDRFLLNFDKSAQNKIMMLVNAIREAKQRFPKAQRTSLQITLKQEEFEKLTLLANNMNMSESELVRKLVKRFLEN